MSDRPAPPENDGRIIPFRPRGTPRWQWPTPPSGEAHGDPLAKYEQGADDDYGHRMKMNLLAFAVTILLVVVGLWIADRIAELRKNEDCILSGRRNCMPIDVPPAQQGWNRQHANGPLPADAEIDRG